MGTAPFWTKVLFKDFIKHFRKMTDNEIAKDIRESMDDLDECNGESASFGSFMVRSSIERISETSEARKEAGLKGAQARWSRQQPTAEQQPIVKPRPLKPPSVQQLYDFCADNSIDEAYAREWYEMCSDRQWKDRAMKPIENWKGALVNYVKNKQT